jgi:hypothetical protein
LLIAAETADANLKQNSTPVIAPPLVAPKSIVAPKAPRDETRQIVVEETTKARRCRSSRRSRCRSQ